MKKRYIGIPLILLAICITCLILLPTEIQATEATSGTCGDNLTWVLADDGTLTISGTGDMADYNEDSNLAPWSAKCEQITTVVIEDGVTSIGNSAFYGCIELTSVTIPASITRIGVDAFRTCSILGRIYITDLAAWCEIAFDCYMSYGHAAMYLNGEMVTDLVIPDGVTSISDGAFAYCAGLDTVTIPDSVTSIGDRAFMNCYGLTSVTIGNGVTTIGVCAFDQCGSLASVTLGNSVTTIGNAAFGRCNSLTSVNLPDSVTSIGDRAFMFTAITSINIPDGVTGIGEMAFYGCISLTSITIPDSVSSIGRAAFACCEKLASINIPDGVTTIGEDAFYRCISLADVTLGNSVTTIGEAAFEGCGSLCHVLYLGTEEQWNAISVGAENSPLTAATRHYEADREALAETCEYCSKYEPGNPNTGSTDLWGVVLVAMTSMAALATCFAKKRKS